MCGFTSRLCSLPLVLGRPAEALNSKPAICFYTTMSHGGLSECGTAYQHIPHKYFFLCLGSFEHLIFSTSFTFSATFFLLPQEPSLLIEVPSFFFITPRSPHSWLKGDFQVAGYQLHLKWCCSNTSLPVSGENPEIESFSFVSSRMASCFWYHGTNTCLFLENSLVRSARYFFIQRKLLPRPELLA